jgi:hypothetical protein
MSCAAADACRNPGVLLMCVMSTQAHARATFQVDSWKDETFDERDGTKLGRAQLTKTFRGDVEGRSSVEILTAQAPQGSAAYVGLERFIGSLDGRSGAFVLVHAATDPQAPSVAVSVLPNSATGELTGLRGRGAIERHPDGSHTFTLDYELP